MLFIQVSNPQISHLEGHTEPNFDRAWGRLFSDFMTEEAFVFWHATPIRLEYGDPYFIDMFDMLLEIVRYPQGGKHQVHCMYNSFKLIWDVSWSHDQVEIQSQWFFIPGIDVKQLNQDPYKCFLQMSKNDFLVEWKMLVDKAISAVEQSQVTLENESYLNELRHFSQQVQGKAFLYGGL